MREALSAIALEPLAVSNIVEAPFIAHRTAELLAEQSKDPICRHLASTIEALGSGHYFNMNEFPNSRCPYRQNNSVIVLRALQVRFLQAYLYL